MLFPLYDSTHADPTDCAESATVRHDGALPNMLYIMVKPSVDLADMLGKYPEVQHDRPRQLLHTTIQPIGTRQWITDADIAACRKQLDRMRHAPFFLRFDRIASGRVTALRAGRLDNCAAQDFRVAILDALSGHFRRLHPYSLDPHMTLDYRGGHRGRMLPQPVVWRVEEFQLVESVHGETRHIEWGRWRLCDD